MRKILSCALSLLLICSNAFGEWDEQRLDALKDVYIDQLTLADDDLIQYNNLFKRWENVTIGAIGDATYLRLDTTNDPLTSDLDVLGYVQARIPTGNYARISHDGTYAVFQTNAGGILLSPGGPNDVVLRMGDAAGANKVYFWDNANIEVASIDSDGAIKGIVVSGNTVLGERIYGNTSMSAPLVTGTTVLGNDLYSSNSVYTAYLMDNFGLGNMDMTGDPWYIGGVSLRVDDGLSVGDGTCTITQAIGGDIAFTDAITGTK